MTNRLNELEKDLPKTKKAFDSFINCIASHKDIASDYAISKKIKSLHKLLEEDLRKEY